ncbi:hypothetical protein NPIL_45311 [Nephila pilipes]|uniref:Uncharacterized protein n=1 Tax=Nephila pilipes TaxID=299642 RepID=A0A8X6P1Z8_NEPPI|nr:hypothetical protein NPIL_45311 [Nephila pilipes]
MSSEKIDIGEYRTAANIGQAQFLALGADDNTCQDAIVLGEERSNASIFSQEASSLTRGKFFFHSVLSERSDKLRGFLEYESVEIKPYLGNVQIFPGAFNAMDRRERYKLIKNSDIYLLLLSKEKFLKLVINTQRN